MKRKFFTIFTLICVINCLTACRGENVSYSEIYQPATTHDETPVPTKPAADINSIPDTNITSTDVSDLIPPYDGTPYCIINDNNPDFNGDEITTEPFEQYSDLDELGRCGPAFANICLNIMPEEPRGEIGMIKPSGWHNHNYHELIEGNYIYNRCHLIGYQLSGENANEKNLITGTRYMNVEGMEPFENQIADYVRLTGHHVLYRVTPVFENDNLVASGVLMEAESVEDDDLIFCVYCYNIQPGFTIDYKTGENWITD